MMQLSPDAGKKGWDWCSSYHYSDTLLAGFSYTHLSGTGCGDPIDILVTPVPGSITPGTEYRTGFSHNGGKLEFILGNTPNTSWGTLHK
jgi:putative alpha-1,2-mannosidase